MLLSLPLALRCHRPKHDISLAFMVFTLICDSVRMDIDFTASFLASEAKTVNVYSGANVMFGDKTTMKIIPSGKLLLSSFGILLCLYL